MVTKLGQTTAARFDITSLHDLDEGFDHVFRLRADFYNVIISTSQYNCVFKENLRRPNC